MNEIFGYIMEGVIIGVILKKWDYIEYKIKEISFIKLFLLKRELKQLQKHYLQGFGEWEFALKDTGHSPEQLGILSYELYNDEIATEYRKKKQLLEHKIKFVKTKHGR